MRVKAHGIFFGVNCDYTASYISGEIYHDSEDVGNYHFSDTGMFILLINRESRNFNRWKRGIAVLSAAAVINSANFDGVSNQGKIAGQRFSAENQTCD